MAEYAAFHQKQRGQPGAKYLVYSACPGYSGLGDRVRGMMYLTRLAAAHQRVVLFTWRGAPHELQRYFPPAGPIDWALDGIDGYEYPDLESFCKKPKNTTFHVDSLINNGVVAFRATDFTHAEAGRRRWLQQRGLKDLARHRFITIFTNERMYTTCAGCRNIAAPIPAPSQLSQNGALTEQVDITSACLYRFLFGVSAGVQEATKRQLVKLYGNKARKTGFQYVAVHMRIGGMEQEASIPVKGGKNGPLMDLIEGLACIRKLGDRVGVDATKVPVLLFTDHHDLRDFVRNGLLANVVTTDLTPTHLARMTSEEAADEDAAMSTYVDVALLAGANCAVYSNSGFSWTAWMLGGGNNCYGHFTRGLNSCLA